MSDLPEEPLPTRRAPAYWSSPWAAALAAARVGHAAPSVTIGVFLSRGAITRGQEKAETPKSGTRVRFAYPGRGLGSPRSDADALSPIRTV